MAQIIQRKFTVNSTDDPLMAQASSADLLESKSLSFVCTLLNSTLYFAADIASGPFHLGTIHLYVVLSLLISGQQAMRH